MLKGRRRVLFRAALVLLPVLFLELSSFVVIYSLGVLGWEVRTTRDIFDEQTERIDALLAAGDGSRVKIDPVLGWTYRPGFESAEHSINAQGVRSFRTYAEEPPDSVLRVAAFGDSFVYCEEVPTEACWSNVAEARAPGLEVLNYGVGGYGTDQAFLRYLSEGRTLSPDIVLIGFAPVNLRRAPNVYRRFVSDRELPLIKPRFEMRGDSLVSLDIAIPDSARFRELARDPRLVLAYGAHDRWFSPWVYQNPLHDLSATVRVFTFLGTRVWRRHLDPDRPLVRDASFNPRSSALDLQTSLLEAFADSVRLAGSTPIVVFFPDLTSVERVRSGRPTTYEILRSSIAETGTATLDLAEAFEAAEPGTGGIGAWFAPGSHYSALGNVVAGEWLTGKLIGVRHPMDIR